MRRPLETTLGSAPAFSGRNELFWTHYPLEQILSLGKHTRYVAQSFCGVETTETAVNELGRSPERPQQGKAEGNGSKPMNFRDWRNASAVDSLQQSVRYCYCSHQWLCLHEARHNSPLLGFRFWAAWAPYPFSRSYHDDGFHFPERERARSRSLSIGCGHPSFDHCEGFLWHPARSSRSRYRQCPPDYDQSTFFLPTLRWQVSDPQLSRSRWPTNRIT